KNKEYPHRQERSIKTRPMLNSVVGKTKAKGKDIKINYTKRHDNRSTITSAGKRKQPVPVQLMPRAAAMKAIKGQKFGSKEKRERKLKKLSNMYDKNLSYNENILNMKSKVKGGGSNDDKYEITY